MKEQLHTIPISDAMANAGECPFCYIERKTEEHMMDFVLGHGASYMEADIRGMTDREGFCRAHFKKMFDYGNSLGNAWILKTLYKRHLEEMDREFKHFKPENTGKKSGFFSKTKSDSSSNSIVNWINRRESTCTKNIRNSVIRLPQPKVSASIISKCYAKGQMKCFPTRSEKISMTLCFLSCAKMLSASMKMSHGL